MASIVATHKWTGGSTGGRQAYRSVLGTNYNNAHKAYIKAQGALYTAERAYNANKKRVSGGLLGYIKRRLPGNTGQQARNTRNTQLNTKLKNAVNAARRNLNMKRKAYYNAGGTREL